MTGAWNFGQLALFAIGGYGAGISRSEFGVSPWLAMLIGALLAAAFNVSCLIPSMRLRGIYVALLTFSFGEVVRLAIINDTSGLTGGVFGLTGSGSIREPVVRRRPASLLLARAGCYASPLPC